MKTCLVTILLFAMTATFASADIIGLTAGQCESFLGAADEGGNGAYEVYHKDGMTIEVEFDVSSVLGGDDAAANRGMTRHQTSQHTGRAICVTYTKQVRHTYFSKDEVKTLLAANGGPVPPTPGRETWTLFGLHKKHADYRRFDGQASARVSWEKNQPTLVKRVRIQTGADLSLGGEGDSSPAEAGY